MANEQKLPEVYILHNTTRSRFNRTQRASSAQHTERQLHIGAGAMRLLKGRPREIDEAWMKEHGDELLELVRAGVVEVRTRGGELIDMRSGSVAVPEPVTPRPNPPLDSANRDTPVGQRFPQMPGGMALSDLTASGGTSTEGIPGPKTAADKKDAENEIIGLDSAPMAPKLEDLDGDPTDEEVPFVEKASPQGKSSRKGGK